VDDIVELRTVVVASSAVKLFTSSEEIVVCLLLPFKESFSVVPSAKLLAAVACVIATVVETFLELIGIVVFSGSVLVMLTVVLMFLFVTLFVTVVVVVFLGFFLTTVSKQDFRPQQRITFLLYFLSCPFC